MGLDKGDWWGMFRVVVKSIVYEYATEHYETNEEFDNIYTEDLMISNETEGRVRDMKIKSEQGLVWMVVIINLKEIYDNYCRVNNTPWHEAKER